jgi:hypothetical protein
MSRLIFEGDLNKNFGEFFPLPYIDKVTIKDYTSLIGTAGYEFDLEISMLFTVPETDPNLPTRDTDLVKDILNQNHVNIIFTKSSKDHISNPTAAIEEARQEALKQQLIQYRELTGIDYANADDPFDELSLLIYDSSILPVLLTHKATDYVPLSQETLDYFDVPGVDMSAIHAAETLESDEYNQGILYDLFEIPKQDFIDKVNDGQYTTIYDKNGRKFLKIKVSVNHKLLISEAYYGHTATGVGLGTQRVLSPTINVLAFSSMYNAEQISSAYGAGSAGVRLRTNAGNKLFFGDVAYEKIMTNGKISNQTEETFFDDNSEVFAETPLETIRGSFHKTDTTTHNDIYEKFNNMLNSYISILPPAPADVESSDPELVGSVDVIQYTLETYKDKIDLLPQINKARKQIINRSIGTRTGALFNDMTELLERANDVASQGTPLTKKLTINAKILDLRALRLGDYELPELVPLTPATADNLINFAFGRTVVATDEDVILDISEYVDRTNFAGIDIGTSLEGMTGTTREYATTGYADDFKIRYDNDGQLYIYFNNADGEEEKIHYPTSAGLFEDSFLARKEYNMTNGYIAVDWQNLIVDHTILATMVDVRKFVQSFGLGLIKKYFIPNEAKLIKNIPRYAGESLDSTNVAFPGVFGVTADSIGGTSGPDDPARTAQTFRKQLSIVDADYHALSSPGAPYIYAPGTEGSSALNGTVDYGEFSVEDAPEQIKLASEADFIFSYMAERSVSFMPTFDAFGATETSPGVDVTEYLPDRIAANFDHRLMYFEFQNFDSFATYIDYDRPVYDEYKFSMRWMDYTKSALVDVIKHYFYLHLALLRYVEDASLECSYNNIDGVFNDFFAESMRGAFIANPAASPWIFCPVVYIRHVDFLTNRYGGDETQMLLAAREIIQRISPETGTLDQLRSFYQNFIDLYTSYYAPGSIIGNMLSSYGIHDESTEDYAHHYCHELELESSWHRQVVFSAQNESERDDFLSAVNQARRQYQLASDRYEEELNERLGDIKERTRQRFVTRAGLLEDKLKYEAEEMGLIGETRTSRELVLEQELQGAYGTDASIYSYETVTEGVTIGCKTAVWWDAWNGPLNPKGRYDFPSEDSSGRSITTNEFGKLRPNNVCDGEFGYYWFQNDGKDTAVYKYPVEKYGFPTILATYLKDTEYGDGNPRCRYVQTGYVFDLDATRYDATGARDKSKTLYGTRLRDIGNVEYVGTSDTNNPINDYAANEFGKWTRTYSYTFDANHIKSFAWNANEYTEDIRHEILEKSRQDTTDSVEDAEFYYLRRIPGYEDLYSYKNYQQWLTDYEAGTVKASAPWSSDRGSEYVSERLFGEGVTLDLGRNDYDD